MRRCPKVFFLGMIAAGLLLVSPAARALTPPIEEPELSRRSDLIVKGEVVDIRCAPNAFEQSANATWVNYIATLKVNTVKKGRWPGHTIPLRFSDVHYFRGYVGDADHVHRIGERGFYYLVSRGDGDWAPLNWSAVIVKRHGEGPLPACR